MIATCPKCLAILRELVETLKSELHTNDGRKWRNPAEHLQTCVDCVWRCRMLADLAACLAAEGEEEPQGWQPIETAPQDGTRVLSFGPDGIVTSYYDPGVKGHEDKFPAGWKNAFAPSHWMPLPAPPVASASPEGE